MTKGLTTKQIAWAGHYALLNNASAAAVKAGYSDNRGKCAQLGQRNLHNERVMTYVQYLRKQMIQQYTSTRQYCTMILKDIIAQQKSKDPNISITAIKQLIDLGGFNRVQNSILNSMSQITVTVKPKQKAQ